MKKQIFLLAFLISGICLKAQDLSLYQKKYHISGTDTLPYRILLPENYKPGKKYPLLFVLHGAGERGNDNESQLIHVAKVLVREDIRKQFPAIVVFPQCPASSYWSNVRRQDDQGNRAFIFTADGEPSLGMKLAQELLYNLLKDYKIKANQVYAAGLSMGGMGTFEIVYRNPSVFAAAVPICGGSDPAIAPAVKEVKWWIFHGAKDNTVLPVNSEIMAKALKDAGADVKFTLYPEAGHNSWDPAFNERELLPWMFSVKRK